VFITDRNKDVVFVKGFDAFPREVEEVIHTHPKVGTVGVVGVPRTGKIVDPAELSAYCASRPVNYKCPNEVRVVGQLPITAAHKLERVALRQVARGEQELRTG
jgi:long-chain acyl-CoA synthetase